MSDLQAIAERVEIEALRGEFTDAVMMRDYDRLASLFTHDGAVRIPDINAEAVSREEIRAGIERLQGVCWTTSCKQRTRARSSLRATPRSAVPTSQSSDAFAAAART
jgi:ketosteroid isomerase-like protein